MLSLTVHHEDLGGGWTAHGSSWRNGKSHIAPLAHPALSIAAIEDGRRTAFIIRERLNIASRDMDPFFVPSRLSSEQYDEELVRSAAWPLDQLTVEIRSEHPRLRILVGSHGTAPLYITTTGGALHADFRVENLYRYFDALEIDREMVAHFLMGSRPYGRRTLLRHVQMLTERVEAYWDEDLSIHYPTPARATAPARLREGAAPVEAFKEILCAVIERALCGSATPWGVEVSGGADSACVALAAAASFGSPRTYGVEVFGRVGTHQRARREDITRLMNATDRAVIAADFPPLSLGTRRSGAPCFAPCDEIYTEAFDALFELAQSDGVRRMLTGIGGDELFLPHAGECDDAPNGALYGANPPDYLTPQTVEIARETFFTIDHAPRTSAPRSALLSLASRAPVFLKRGIWPVSPLVTPELVNFCRRLPFSWRHGKNLARQLLLASSCHYDTAHPLIHESFHGVYTQAMRYSARHLLNRLFQAPKLSDLGLVDRDRLLSAYADYSLKGVTRGDERFYEIAAIELMLSR